MSGLAELGNLWHSIQTWLFPMLEDELGEPDDQHCQFVAVCEICSCTRSTRHRLCPNLFLCQNALAAVPANPLAQNAVRLGPRVRRAKMPTTALATG